MTGHTRRATAHPSLVTCIQGLIHFPLVKEPFLRFKRPAVQDPDELSIRPIHAENSNAARRHSQVEKTRLNAKPRRIRQQPDGKRIFKGLFNFPLGQRTIQLEGRIVPIKLHNELTVNRTPMQCLYNVFTHGHDRLSTTFVFS
ncbi:MAG TPA: hypothetical protein VF430_00265 [Verrucomicrobiae bacterium]